MARWLLAPAPLAKASGKTPNMKATDVMMMGLKRRWQAFQRGFNQALAFQHQVLGEFNDQDGVSWPTGQSP